MKNFLQGYVGFRLGWIQELKQYSQGLVFLYPSANFLHIVTPSQQSQLKKTFYLLNFCTTPRHPSHWPSLESEEEQMSSVPTRWS